MENTIVFNVENSTRENVNVANAASDNNNVVNATSNESKKKTAKKMKFNESFEKRIKKDGQFRTNKFKIDEVAKIIELAQELKKAIEKDNKQKNVTKIVNFVKKLNITNPEIDEVIEQLVAMKTAA